MRLRIAPPGVANEFSATPELAWDAEPGVQYTIQVSTNPAVPAAWESLEVVGSSAGGPLKWMAPESLRGSRFYRLATAPAVFDVQPAFVDANDPAARLYILGQLLPDKATVMIHGQSFALSLESPGVWVADLKGLPPGSPIRGTLSVMDAGSGAVVAAFPVEGPLVYGPALSPELLQGPAEEPPASAVALAIFASKKGYDYYQAQSAMASTGLQNNPAFVENNTAGNMPASERFGGRKGYDYYQAQMEMSSARELKGAKGDVTLIKREMAPRRGGIAGGVIAGIVVAARAGGGKGDDGNGSGLEVSGATGELRCEATDLAIPGAALDFAWVRTYRSRTGPLTAQGAGWDFSYNVSLDQNSDGTVTLHPGNGRADTFYPAGTNGWFRNEYFCQIIDLDANGMPDVVFADGSRWLFNPPGTPAGGKLWKIVDRNGNTMALGYDTAGRLETVVDDLGRSHTVAYDAVGRILSVTDFSGRAVRYEYDAQGSLVACVSPATPDFPGGITNRYTYTSGNADERLNHNLTGCIDGKGQAAFQIAYSSTTDPMSIDFDAVTSTQRGIDKKDIRRIPVAPSAGNGFARVKLILRDAMGNVTEAYYDTRGRCVRTLEYTGRSNPDLPVTETDNRPKGKLRAGDPDYYETGWAWNADSLCTSETLPDGTVIEYVYQRAFNQNSSRSNHGRTLGPIDDSLHNADLRVVRVRAAAGTGGDLDGDGAPDITDLTWRFEYDPRFGTTTPGATVKKSKTVEAKQGVKKMYDSARMLGGGFDGDNTPIIKGSALGGLTGKKWLPANFKLDLPASSARKGWDGTIKGSGVIDEARKGWDGTIKGSGVTSEARKGWDGKIKGSNVYSDARKGWDGTIKGSAVVEGGDFCVRSTDPRGNLTISEYDSSGNCVRMRKRPEILFQAWDEELNEFDYNNRGQLTGVTNSPDANGYRRVDRIDYYSSGPQSGQVQSIAIDEPGVHLTSSFEYDNRGNLTRYVDPRGNDWLYAYNDLDLEVTRQTPANSFGERVAASTAYDANGNPVQFSKELFDENGAFLRTVITRAECDGVDRCTALVGQAGPGAFVTNRFEYDANGQLAAEYSPMAVSGEEPLAVVRYEYDERGLLFREIAVPGSSTGGTNEFDYDANGRVSAGRLGIGVTAVSGTFTAPPGRIGAKQKAWLCSNFRLRYDGLGRLSAITNEMGNVLSFAFDRNGNLAVARCYGETADVPGSAKNQLLAETRFTYDGLDRCVKVSEAFFETEGLKPIGKGTADTLFAYAANGACTRVTDDNGHTTLFGSDTAGRLVLVTDPRGNTVAYTRDASGNVLQVTQTDRPDAGGAAQTFSVTRAFDKLHRMTRCVDSAGNTNSYGYDSLGRLARQIDPLGTAAWHVYDDLGRRVLSVGDLDGDGAPDLAHDTWSADVFDANSRCVASTDSHTNRTFFAYDAAGNCTWITNADLSVTKLVWSPRSNLLSLEDPNGTTVANVYDACNRIVHRDLAARNVLLGATFENIAYDGLDRCVAAANDSSASTFAYDSLGSCLRTTQDGQTSACTYDGVGNALSVTCPDGTAAAFSYNEVDDVTGMSSGGVLLAGYSYAGPGRLALISRVNGVETRIQWNGRANTPNAAGDYGWMQANGISHQRANNGAVLDRRLSAFDRSQNRTLRQLLAPALGGNLETNLFEYDARDRQHHYVNLRKSVVDDFSLVLDRLGNRVSETANGATGSYSMSDTLPPGDFQMSRYTGTPSSNESYDANGNLISSGSAAGVTLYEYDCADRLMRISTLGADGTPQPLVSFVYDALSRCISRTTYDPAGGTLETIYYIHRLPGEVCDDGGNDDPIQERNGGPGGPVLRTHIAPHVLEPRPIQRKLAVAAVLANAHLCERSGGVVLDGAHNPVYPLGDDLGNLLAITDASGAVLERYSYGAFGAPAFLTSDGMPKFAGGSLARVSDFGMSRLFRAMEWEPVAGLYRKHRAQMNNVQSNPLYEDRGMSGNNPFYNPSTGRCLTPVRCFDGSCSAYDPFEGNPWSLACAKPREKVGHVTLIK